MITTVIFDMDGVIVDTEPVHMYAYKQLFRELNIEVSNELYATFTGNSTKNVMQKLIHHFQLNHAVDVLVKRKRTLFNNAFDTKHDLSLLDGVEPLLKDLHSNGFQMILASSSAKETIHRIFNRFNLYSFFSHIVSGEDFEFSKPHPAIFEEAVRLSTHSKENCLVIEDSTNGVKAAKAAGLFCIGYQSFHSKGQLLDEADVVVPHFDKLNAAKIKSISSSN